MLIRLFDKLISSSVLLLVAFSALFLPSSGFSDERYFTYSYDAEVLPKGQSEFEQWITARVGKKGGDYARWDFREEFEYGLTERLTTALYLNFTDVYSSPRPGSDSLSSKDGTE